MKIVGQFHDYYDAHQATDREHTPLYIRTSAEHAIEERAKTHAALALRMPHIPGNDHRFPFVDWYDSKVHHRETGVVAFCGKRYPFWRVGVRYCYTLAQVISACKGVISEVENKEYFDRERYKIYKTILERLGGTKHTIPGPIGHTWGELNIKCWEHWQEHMRSHTIMKDDIFLHEKAPIIAVDGDLIRINPNLRKMDFHTIMDPFTAYQELSMFLGNNMAQQLDPVPKTTDELKAHAHGYDKWSFRTHKEDSKKYKKRKAKESAKKSEVTLDDSDFKL